MPATLASRARVKAHYLLWSIHKPIVRRRCAAQYAYDVEKTYWIDPKRITRAFSVAALDRLDPNAKLPFRIHPLLEHGRILGGDWDLKTIAFEDMDVWKAFTHRFVDGKPWSETSFYRRIANTIGGGVRMWGCTSQAEFEVRLEKLDALFKSIQEGGYRTQDELGATSPAGGNGDEVQVHIGRDGDYIFADGRHRLSIAKILGLDRIPVKVSRRHKRWASFRRDIQMYIRQGGKLYAPILHPDLSDMPSVQGHERMQLLKQHLAGDPGRMLDIGSHWGYFCHCFEELGYQCTAVEYNDLNIRFLEKLRRAQNKGFQVRYGSVLDQDFPEAYDVVLALNIFHHFLKEEVLHQKLIHFLSKLDARMMFFESHCPNEPQMRGSFRNYAPDDFAEFVQSHGRFRSCTKIGESPDGRSLFQLVK